jgi:tight adherence protein B
MKLLGLGLAWAGTAGIVYLSTVHPRGLLRRMASDYVAGLDADFRAMFLPQRGAALAWLQVLVVVSCVAVHAVKPAPAFLTAAFLAAGLPRAIVTRLVQRRRARIDEQANGFSLALSNSLRTTASVGEALRFTAEVTAKPLREEIETALREIHVGSTVEEALLATAGRSCSPALDVVVSALLIGQKTGGDLPRILEGTAGSLRELKRLEEHTDKVLRGAKISLAMTTGLTAVLAGVMARFVPGFFDPLLRTTHGRVILIQCAAAYLFALYLGWRFTRKSI